MLAQKPDAFQTPEQLSDFINKSFTTEHEKYRAVFRWVTHNIKYSYQLRSGNAQEVFKARKGICNGYSELMVLLCDLCKIKCRKITGIVKLDEDYLENQIDTPAHAWNIVTLNGNEYLTDATWAAGGYDDEKGTFSEELSDEYFLPPPSSFILNHFPEKTADQLLKIPVSKKTFSSAPVFFSKAINYEVSEFSPANGIIKTTKGKTVIFSFQLNYPPDKVDVDLYKDEDDKNPISTSISFTLTENKLSFPLVFDKPGKYLMYIQFDLTDAICYEVEISE
jgi:transglutaminase-like putative cysteine protease